MKSTSFYLVVYNNYTYSYIQVSHIHSCVSYILHILLLQSPQWSL